MPTIDLTHVGVLKYGVGYQLIVVEQRSRLVLGIRCTTCHRTSFHPTDVRERYCGACHVFHEDRVLEQIA